MIDRDIKEAVEAWRAVVEREASNRPNITTSLVLGVIARESRGDAQAAGSTGDFGLMQITRPAWQDYQTATGDPETVLFPDSMLVGGLNIRVGSWFLNHQIAEMGNTFDGLRAYNAGVTGASRNPTAGANYAKWVTEIGEPSFRGAVA